MGSNKEQEKALKKLIGMVSGMMEKNAIEELEVEHNDQGGLRKVRIKKAASSSSNPIQVVATQAPPAQVLVPTAPPEEAPQLDEDLEEIVSPMVGTFYVATNPGDPPYVQEGDEVKKGDILCLVEAMKLMNEIESPHDGKIVSIAVDNAQPVEYGERLFLIKPY